MQILVLYYAGKQPRGNIRQYDVETYTKIYQLKQDIVENNPEIFGNSFYLSFRGNILDNDMTIDECQIRQNDMLFMNINFFGGYTQGFPDIGMLLIMSVLSFVVLIFGYKFFDSIIESISHIKIRGKCNPLPNYDVQEGGFDMAMINWKTIYRQLSIFYISFCIISITIYYSTISCDNGVPTNIFASIVLSGFLIILLLIGLYYSKLQYVLEKDNIYMIASIIFLIIILSLFIISILSPYLTKGEGEGVMFHWGTYIYPFLISFAGYLANIILISQYGNILKLFGLTIIGVLMVILPYVLVYMANLQKLCLS